MPTHNSDITENLHRVANLLEIEGGNPFRVRAYREAARTIGGLSKNAFCSGLSPHHALLIY